MKPNPHEVPTFIHIHILRQRLEMNRSTASVLPQSVHESMTGELNNEFIAKYLQQDDVNEEVTKESKAARDAPNRRKSEKATSITSLLIKQNLINRIGDISEYSQIRKLSIPFNSMMKSGLQNLDQLPHLRHLSAYSCGLKHFEDLADN